MVHNPLFIFGEFLVVAAGLIHGFNGIRIVLTSLGIGVPQQKVMLVVLMALAVIGSLVFGYHMITA
jgi:succinate dehydrogenase / fumarate reductase, cytochrome b subunit